MPQARDIQGNRQTSRYSWREYAGRGLWAVAKILFRCIPGPLKALRNWLLQLFGARIGAHVHIQRTADIAIPWNLSIGDFSSLGDHARIYNLGPVTIGARTTISQYAHLCAGTHDHNDPLFPLLKPPITVGDDVWVCADAFIGPGVTVGDHAIVAAAAVAVKDVPCNTIVAGNPARVVRTRA